MPKNKTKEKNTAASGAPGKSLSRVWKLSLAFLLLLCVCAGLALLFYGGRTLLFSGNERFRLRRVEVVSDGFWQNRAVLLARALDLKVGRDNLYELDLKALRERAAALPSIERCRLQRILPDTLRFVIVERVPRARLQSSRDLLVDSEGVLIRKDECLNYSANLPLIAGVSERELKPGGILTSAQPALKLIMQTLRNYPDMEIVAATVNRPEKLVFFVRYRQMRLIKVTMPNDIARLQPNLNALRSAILQAISEGNRSNSCDLSFDGMVVWGKPPELPASPGGR